MNSYNIPEVTKLCTLSDDALDINRQAQVAHLSSIAEMDIEQAKASTNSVRPWVAVRRTT